MPHALRSATAAIEPPRSQSDACPSVARRLGTFPRLPSTPLLPPALMIEIARQRRAGWHHQIGRFALQTARELVEPCRGYVDARMLITLDRAHLDGERLCKFPL